MFYIIMLRRFYDVYSLVVRMYMCDLKMQSEFVGDCVGELSYRAECLGGSFFIQYVLHIISVLVISNSSVKFTPDCIS